MKFRACTGISETPDREPTLTDIDLKKTLQQHLDALRWSGLGELPRGGGLEFDFSNFEAAPQPPPAKPTQSAKTATRPVAAQAATQTTAPAPVVAPPEPAPVKQAQPALLAEGDYGDAITDVGERNAALTVIAEEVSACTQCPELCRTRSKTVFGIGSAEAKIVFLGEGPGANEDQQGEPFVGAAGQLLDKILSASGLSREQVYIVNVVKCRPPGNRNPADGEIQNCWNYLERQLEIIQPTHIVCLGSVAAKSLLNTKLSLGKMRKQWHQYRNSKVIVTYHPAYLLRTPTAKKHVWEDMKLLMAEFGVEL